MAAPALEDDAQKQREIAFAGEKARQFLENPLWALNYQAFEDFIWEQIKKTESRDAELLQHWKRMHVAGQQFKAWFEHTVADGKFATKDLEFKEQQSRWQKLKAAVAK